MKPQREHSPLSGLGNLIIAVFALTGFLYWSGIIGAKKKQSVQEAPKVTQQEKKSLVLHATEPLTAFDFHNNVRIKSMPCIGESAPAECLNVPDNVFRIQIPKELITHFGVAYISVGTACFFPDRNEILIPDRDIVVDFGQATAYGLGTMVDCLQIPKR